MSDPVLHPLKNVSLNSIQNKGRNGLLDLRDTNLHNDEKEEEGMKIMTDALTVFACVKVIVFSRCFQ